MVAAGYVMALLGGYPGVLVAGALLFSEHRGKGGVRRWRYGARARRHGVAIAALGAVLSVVWSYAIFGGGAP